jgi:hypothetical protein
MHCGIYGDSHRLFHQCPLVAYRSGAARLETARQERGKLRVGKPPPLVPAPPLGYNQGKQATALLQRNQLYPPRLTRAGVVSVLNQALEGGTPGRRPARAGSAQRTGRGRGSVHITPTKVSPGPSTGWGTGIWVGARMTGGLCGHLGLLDMQARGRL